MKTLIENAVYLVDLRAGAALFRANFNEDMGDRGDWEFTELDGPRVLCIAWGSQFWPHNQLCEINPDNPDMADPTDVTVDDLVVVRR